MGKKEKDVKSTKGPVRTKSDATDVMRPATLRDLRKRSGQTQQEMAALLGIGQETISRLEKRSDMLLSTLHHYVETIGGQLALVATFPDQPPVVIHCRSNKKPGNKKHALKKA